MGKAPARGGAARGRAGKSGGAEEWRTPFWVPTERAERTPLCQVPVEVLQHVDVPWCPRSKQRGAVTPPTAAGRPAARCAAARWQHGGRVQGCFTAAKETVGAPTLQCRSALRRRLPSAEQSPPAAGRRAADRCVRVLRAAADRCDAPLQLTAVRGVVGAAATRCADLNPPFGSRTLALRPAGISAAEETKLIS